MNFDLVNTFARFKIGKLVAAEDFCDKFHYQITCVLLLFLTALIGIRQYVFTPIQCWTPAVWKSAWEEFAENYCWVQNTYFTPVHLGPPHEIEKRKILQIGYYQWVPFILLGQVLSCYLPHLLWRIVSRGMGTDINAIVRYADQCATIDQEKKKKLISYLAKQIFQLVEATATKKAPRSEQKSLANLWSCLCTGRWTGKRSGRYLVFAYMMIKLVYLAVDLANLWLIKQFFDLDSENGLLFGWSLMRQLAFGTHWEVSGKFPRVTWCDVPRMEVGNPVTRTIMCVLPLNMINEKIFLLLWFWFVAASILILVSLCVWTVRLVCMARRKRFTKRLVYLGNISPQCAPNDAEKARIKQFLHKFLRFDGIFLLRMISINAGDLVAADVLTEVWRLWRSNEAPDFKRAYEGNRNTPSKYKMVYDDASDTAQFV